MATPLGLALLNSALPEKYRFKEAVTNKVLTNTLSVFAKDDPKAYAEAVTKIKRLGDEFSTYEGISVGLDDIAPDYKKRDPILKDAAKSIQDTEDPLEVVGIIKKTQDKLLDAAQTHPGDLTLMARSGGRGNFNQMLKTVSTPVGVKDAHGQTVPWLIMHSYSEGLTPAESWIAGDEARAQVVEGKLAVEKPGDAGKWLTAAMADKIITEPDCGTHNGIFISTKDNDGLYRFLAKDTGVYKRNTLITPEVLNQILKKYSHITVRSPMTCEATQNGVCQKCMGLDERGNLHPIGTNVGIRSAQAMTEPLTQMVLSSKHAAGLVKMGPAQLEGLEGLSTILKIPKIFLSAAPLASLQGKVTDIKPAPQGGSYIFVENKEHYAPPGVKVLVDKGQEVEAGDVLAEGIPRPNELVKYKGLGVGRAYIVDQLSSIFKRKNVNLDRRHLELLAKSHLNHAQITYDPKEEFINGDVVVFNKLKERLSRNSKELPISKAEGELLAEDYLHYTAGTRITKSVIAALKPYTDKVLVATNAPEFQFIMKPIDSSPLLDPDWLARMSHRKLKDTLLDAAANAEETNLHGTHPMPGFVYGIEFNKVKGRFGEY